MKYLWLLALLPLTFSCRKNRSADEVYSPDDMNLKELINSDEYFKTKKKSSNRGSDSLEVKIVELEDINLDGIKDTAWIVYNNLNSVYKVKFSCFPGTITESKSSELLIKDVGDLNNDNKHEILFFLKSEESCWDEIKLYSYIDKWVEKYNGLTYQCTENNNYQFRKLNDNTVQIMTYGVNKDSIDITNGDTLENIIPNAKNLQTIHW
ncbi:MAG TPA: hypothetical protein VGF79_02950 [Bacteroidia bacterium]